MGVIGLIIVGLLLVVGIVGSVVPVLPGPLLIWGTLLVWAIFESSTSGWVLFGFATVLLALVQLVKYLVPGKRLTASGVPLRSIMLGALVAIAGFFVVPVIGLLLGFPLGIYLSERQRLGSSNLARRSTVEAVKAIGLSILIEVLGSLLVVFAWLAVVIVQAF